MTVSSGRAGWNGAEQRPGGVGGSAGPVHSDDRDAASHRRGAKGAAASGSLPGPHPTYIHVPELLLGQVELQCRRERADGRTGGRAVVRAGRGASVGRTGSSRSHRADFTGEFGTESDDDVPCRSPLPERRKTGLTTTSISPDIARLSA